MRSQHSSVGSPILLFGANGQLGQELQSHAQKNGLRLRALERAEADIADVESVRSALQKYKPAVIVNAAAYTRVDDAEVEKDTAWRANSVGPEVLARTCEEAGCSLIHISTDYVFDGTKPSPYVETDSVAPIGFYGETKAAGESAIRSQLEAHLILRVSWLYGRYGNNFLKTILKLASQRDEIRVVADQYGSPTSTQDVAKAVFAAAGHLQNKSPAIWGTYHFSGDGSTTWHGFAEVVVRCFSQLRKKSVRVAPITTEEYPTKAKRPINSVLNCSKFESAFGFRGSPWRVPVWDTTTALVGG